MVGYGRNRHFGVNLAYIRSVLDHGKYAVKLQLSTVGVHSFVFLLVSVVAMAKKARNESKTEEKMDIFVICVILKSVAENKSGLF